MVELHGLVGQHKHLNGRQGMLMRFEASKGLWEVQLIEEADGVILLKFKPENLRCVAFSRERTPGSFSIVGSRLPSAGSRPGTGLETVLTQEGSDYPVKRSLGDS